MKVFLRGAMFVGAIALGFAACAVAQNVPLGTLTGHFKQGEAAFPRYCNGCHGVRGDGKGTLAPYLDPKPRDYTMGVFKCRSTPTGSLPTDEDLFNTMTRGIVTAAMPPWAPLPPQTRIDIVVYLKGFSPRFANEAPGIPIVIPAESPVTVSSIKHGAELYQKLACAKCHGAKGHGDGPDAPTLFNIKHEPLPPYDFTVTERFKCGVTNSDLYRTFMTGMDGSPMLSYADKLTPDQAWDLVHFVRTLQVARKSKENSVLAEAGGQKLLLPSQP
ncbi:MAG TPA: cytochrome c [Terracidiphilus sp.]|jgi:cytochrome c oxidase cbb3-type subunit 2|nr:cytochrome c [Terracidiphilus sp.]